jgi:hypothetical protein
MTTILAENTRAKPPAGALTLARGVLKILIVLNWLYGACILAALIISPIAGWPALSPSPENARLLVGMRAVAILILVGIPLHYVVLTRLLDIVETVRAGTPFVAQNAVRLNTIAWSILGLQTLSLIMAAIAKGVSTRAYAFRVDAAFSTGGWLAVILLFVLARVFSEGARMRDELEGTV